MSFYDLNPYKQEFFHQYVRSDNSDELQNNNYYYTVLF